MRRHSRRLGALLLLSTFALSACSGGDKVSNTAGGKPSNSTTTTNVAAASETGMGALRTCLGREDARLNILYLIDYSGSMKSTDPERLRGDVIKSSVELFSDLKSSGRPLSIAMGSFGSAGDSQTTNLWEDWQEVPSTSAGQEALASQIGERAAKVADGNTDWYAGLTEVARPALESRVSDPNSCSVLVWLTDGAIDPIGGNADDPDRIQAQQQSFLDLCVSDSRRNGGSAPVIDWFRHNGVLVLGALLNTKADAADPAISLFEPIVTGSSKRAGEGLSAVGLDGGTQCGTSGKGFTTGLLVEARSPADLGWEFLELVAAARGLKTLGAPSADGSFTIDPGIGRVEVDVKSGAAGSPQIVDGSGKAIACAETGSVCTLKKGSISTSLTVSVMPGRVAPGVWKVQGVPAQSAKVFGGLGVSSPDPILGMSASPSEFVEGEEATVSLAIREANGDPFNAGVFKAARACVLPGAGVKEAVCKPISGTSSTVPFDVRPGTSDDEISFVLELETQSGVGLEKQFSQPISVQALTSMPGLQLGDQICTEAKPCTLNVIRNPLATSKTELKVVSPAGVEGTLEFQEFVATYDPLGRRIDRYKSSFEPGKLETNKQSTVLVGLKNDQAYVSCRDGIDAPSAEPVLGKILYEASANGKSVQRALYVQFCTENQKDPFALAIAFIFLLLLGVAIPYFVLYIAARRQAVLAIDPDSGLRWAKVDVSLDPSGSPNFSTLDPDGFKISWAGTHEGTRSEANIEGYRIWVEQPTLKTALRPIRTHISAPGNLVWSNSGSSAGTVAPDMAEVRQGLVDSAVVMISSDQISATTTQVAGDVFGMGGGVEQRAATGPVVGSMLVFGPGFGTWARRIADLDRIVRSDGMWRSAAEQITKMREAAVSAPVETSKVETSTPSVDTNPFGFTGEQPKNQPPTGKVDPAPETKPSDPNNPFQF